MAVQGGYVLCRQKLARSQKRSGRGGVRHSGKGMEVWYVLRGCMQLISEHRVAVEITREVVIKVMFQECYLGGILGQLRGNKFRVRKPTQKSAAVIRQCPTVEIDKTGVCRNEGGDPVLIWIRDCVEILMKAVDLYLKRSPQMYLHVNINRQFQKPIHRLSELCGSLAQNPWPIEWWRKKNQ